MRWSLILSAYGYKFLYMLGKTIGHRDKLSRLSSKNLTREQPADISLLKGDHLRVLSYVMVVQAPKVSPIMSKIHYILL